MTKRRYGDEEVREIFRIATTGDAHDQSLPAESGGLTVNELQRIGQEAGIEPVRIAQAAEMLDSRGPSTPVRRSLGMQVGVSRVIGLPRAPTDREWEQLISGFRTTFGAQGRASISGGLREWSHGRLHISVEPAERGEQLRLSTVKESGVALNLFGLAMGGMSVLMAAMVTAAGKLDKALLIVGLFGGVSLLSFGTNLIRLPRWVRERERQLDAIAEHAVKLLSRS